MEKYARREFLKKTTIALVGLSLLANKGKDFEKEKEPRTFENDCEMQQNQYYAISS